MAKLPSPSFLNPVKKHPVWTFIFLFFATVAALVGYAASLENFDVRWTRAVPSKLPTEVLGEALADFTIWPVFHHHLKQANARDASGKDLSPEESKLMTGQTLRYVIEPPKKEWKRFEFYGQVREYNPHRRLEVEFESDSTGKITRLFEDYSWSIEILPATDALRAKGFQSIVRGEAAARTTNWRGRLFAKFSPRILMNQVYYLDLVKFGTLDRQIEAKKNNFAPNYQ